LQTHSGQYGLGPIITCGSGAPIQLKRQSGQRCMLPDTRCPLHVVRCTLSAARCPLQVVRWIGVCIVARCAAAAPRRLFVVWCIPGGSHLGLFPTGPDGTAALPASTAHVVASHGMWLCTLWRATAFCTSFPGGMVAAHFSQCLAAGAVSLPWHGMQYLSHSRLGQLRPVQSHLA
jgi:hypothetical protein